MRKRRGEIDIENKKEALKNIIQSIDDVIEILILLEGALSEGKENQYIIGVIRIIKRYIKCFILPDMKTLEQSLEIEEA